MALAHELAHALRYLNDRAGYDKDTKTSDENYDDKEEKRVIEGEEQEVAKKLGEIKEGETTRTNHKGFAYETEGITSTKPKQEEKKDETKKK